MCPIDSHVVRGHYRTCASATQTWVDTHYRRKISYLKIKDQIIFMEIKSAYANAVACTYFSTSEGFGNSFKKLQIEIAEHNFTLGKKLFSYEILEEKLTKLFKF